MKSFLLILVTSLVLFTSVMGATMFNCFSVEQMFSSSALTTLVKSPVKGTTYFTKIGGLRGGVTSYQNTLGSDTCDGVCPDDTVMSFRYDGSSLTCSLTPVSISACTACTHYCTHVLSKTGDLTSKDMCYGPLLTPPTAVSVVSALQGFWTAFALGTMSSAIQVGVSSSALSLETRNCLASYVGLKTPPSVGYCYAAIGSMCFGVYCINNDGVNMGLTNNPPNLPTYPKDVKSKLRCRISQALSDYSVLKACDECVVESLAPSGSSWVIPGFVAGVNLREVCNLVTYSVAANTYDVTTISSLATWLFNQPRNTFLELVDKNDGKSLHAAQVITANAQLVAGVYGIDVKFLFTSESDVKTAEAILLKEEYSPVRYLIIDGKSTLDQSTYSGLANKVSGVRGAFRGSHLCVDETCIRAQWSLVQHADVAISSFSPSVMLSTLALTSNIIKENDYVSAVSTVQSQRTNFYYYIGGGIMTYCPSIVKYVSGAVISYQPLSQTTSIPFTSTYITTNQSFTCSQGSPTPAVTCSSAVTQGISLTTLLTSSAQPNDVIFNVPNKCFIYVNSTSAQLCNFKAAGTSLSSQYFMINNRIISALDDRGPYKVGLYGFYKIVDGYDYTVEMFPIDVMCNTPSLMTVPDCMTAVCGADATCRSNNANNVCVMDASMRDSVLSVLARFTEAQALYTKITSIKANWQQNNNVRNRRFVEWIALGVAAAGLARAEQAYALAERAEATSAIALAAAETAVHVSMDALNASKSAVLLANMSLNIAGDAYALANRTSVALTQLTNKVDVLANTINILDGRLNSLESAVTVLGDQLYIVSSSLQKNIDKTNSRISDLQESVNARFSAITTFINTVTSGTATGLSYLQSAFMYYQQLMIFNNQLHSATEKLIMQSQMYATCLQSIFNRRLYGCPLDNDFLSRYPDYLLTRSVEGAVFKDGVMSVMYRVPSSVTPMALYVVIVKGFVVGQNLYTIDASDTVLGADNNYYKRPSCDENYCAPLVKDINFATCIQYLTAADFSSIQKYCNIRACSMMDCSDVNKITMYNGTFSMPTTPYYTFTFTDTSKITHPLIQQFVYQNISSSTNLGNISDSLQMLTNSQTNMLAYINANNQSLSSYINNFSTEEIYATLNDSLSHYLPDSINQSISAGQQLAHETIDQINVAMATANAALSDLAAAAQLLDSIRANTYDHNAATNANKTAVASIVLTVLFSVTIACLFGYLRFSDQIHFCGAKKNTPLVKLVNRRVNAVL
ncbi:hypothetical protein [Ranid herpesvirus 3]|uniref:Uncharacterized protein n=1 Tax=Ranid herpesvirus 3 TaxID=1987509 RepID=A0A1X9T5E6_9VIRU|nr:hypothetical protein [Ranid herpesvirus 3]ARR28921.1 hypothetical protein [Ranid herpesvirus 3]